MPRRLLLAVALAAATTAGCTSSSSPQPAPTTPPPSVVSTECASAAPPTTASGPRRPLSWESEAPAGMPKPPGVVVSDSTVGTDGVRIVRATTPTTLREATLFVVREFPPAGFTLGRGDAEATEADAPFQHGDERGLVRLLWSGGCETQWLIATASSSGGGSPLLPARSPSGSPSPLPFG